MEKTLITTGKTIDLAIETALAQLGLERDDVSVQVLAQAKAGFLGFGAAPAKVQVTYEAPDPAPEAPKVALSSASRSKPKAAAPAKKPEPKVEAKPEPKAEAPQAKEEAPKASKQEAPKAAPKAPKQEKAPRQPKAPKEVKAPAAPKTYAPAEAGSTEEKIEQFLKGLLEHMGSEAVPHAWKESEDTYKVDLVGDDLGYLIGRRGDTLDAIQHLCNYSVKRGVEGHIRINVDAEAYREKREDSLCRYARK